MKLITDAIVLRRADWRDYDRMVTLLTPNGTLDAVVRGCRRPKSPLLSAAEPFTAGEYVIFQGGSHYTVEQFHASDTYYPLREDYEKLIHGAYYLRMAGHNSAPDSPCGELFTLLLHALAHLTYGELPPSVVTMAFELHLLALQGLAPRMDMCVRCSKPIEDAAWFDASGGGVVCEKCRGTLPNISNGARRIMYKVPITRFSVIEKLLGHPDVLEASKFTRSFFLQREEIPLRDTPDII